MAITALTASAKNGSKTQPLKKLGTKADSMDDATYGKNGAKMAKPARAHAPKLR